MSIFSRVSGFFMGGAAKAGVEVAEGVADIIERWRPGDQKNQEMAMEMNSFLEKSYADSRKHDQPMSSGIPIIDALVNGVNRLIRPWVTITVLGSLFGYWDLPPPNSIDPQYWVIAQIVLGFWFGGRFLVKDIPQGLKSLVR
jgi:hypothetical protein